MAITFFWDTAEAAAIWSFTASPTQRETPSLRPPVKIQAPVQIQLVKGNHKVVLSPEEQVED